jgi:hypothetical protein
MRKLSSKELYNGIYVQCQDVFGAEAVVYQIIIRDGKHFYREVNSNWEIPGDILKDIWIETEETKMFNRDNKLKELGI